MSQPLISNWGFWLSWAVAFLGFPLGGVLANLGVGPVSTPLRGFLAGLITGAVLGAVQWWVLRSHWPLTAWWIAATGLGMAVGLAAGIGLWGTETAGNALLLRALITGVGIGVAQWLVLQPLMPNAFVWSVMVALAWPLGWWITRSVGVDLSQHWSVFGSTGAWAFQFVTGVAILFLTQISQVK